MQNIEIDQAGHRLPELIEKSINGNEIVITNKGLPVAKIIGIAKKKKHRRFDSAKGLIKISEDFDRPLEDFKDYM